MVKMGAEGPHADHKTARMAISLEGFCSWTTMQDPTARDTKEHIRRLGWERLDHSAFIQDLAPSDFHLFPALRSAISRCHFRSNEEGLKRESLHADVYIVRCELEKAISHPIVAITEQDVDPVVLLIALAPPEIDFYFMKSGKRKLEAKLISTRKAPKRTFFSPNHPPSPCIQ
ncbi:hypothetical protein AVEN_180385-1 [Araneus ventricosus]|uniref:Uncharacterized protein n=1 Tax=Araneus ventricosus TaxID=182803 RepID=A0A4Y2P589_ARAVE|nr:hypothetical protein AVEN_180385-1 [Araneus ventricosus]